MIPVTEEFLRRVEDRGAEFAPTAFVTLKSGDVITLTGDDLRLSNNSIYDGAGANVLPLGVAVSRGIQIEIMNVGGRFAGVDFTDAEIELQLGLMEEILPMGTFTVLTSQTYGGTIIITAQDDMHRADKPFTAAVLYPVSLRDLFRVVCEECGLTADVSGLPNGDYAVVRPIPAGLTCRAIIGYIAMLAGGNAHISRTRQLEILTYDFAGLERAREEEDPEGVDVLRNWINLRVDLQDVVITGIQTTRTVTAADGSIGSQTIICGSEGYVLTVDNPLIAGNETAALELIANILVGGELRSFAGDHTSWPLAEFMDLCRIYDDRSGTVYHSIITDLNIILGGMTTLSNSAETPTRSSAAYTTQADKALVKAYEADAQLERRVNSYIEQTAESIEAGVSEAYETKTDATSKYNELNSQITITAEGIEQSVAETYTTKSTFNTTVQNLQDQIDDSIETFTGSAVPTLNNAPAKNWKTTTDRDSHIGDLYIVNSSGGDHAGFYYRFEKSGSTYQWVLLKDTEITKALADAASAKAAADAVGADLETNYSTTTEMNSAIQQSASNITSTVSATYETKSDATAKLNSANSHADTVAGDAESAAKGYTDNKLTSYSTTAQMNSAISQSASSITSTVSATYETKSDATSKLNTAKSYAESEADAAESSAKSYADTQVSSAKSEIKQTTDAIESTVSTKVGNNEVISKINQSAEQITIDANRVDLQGVVSFTNVVSAGRNIALGTGTPITVKPYQDKNWCNPSNIYKTTPYGMAQLEDTDIEKFTVSFDWSATGVDTAVSAYAALRYTENYTYRTVNVIIPLTVGECSGHSSIAFTPISGMRQWGTGWMISGLGTNNRNAEITLSNFKFEVGSVATQWTKAPEDVEDAIESVSETASGANSREQTIYISKVSGTTSVSANTTWVTNTTGGQNTWTTKRPVFDRDHPVLFVATQRQTVAQSGGTTCSCTTPVIDKTTTVIDGGNIITGTVTANQLAANSVTADKIKAGEVTSAKLAADSVTAEKIKAGEVTSVKLAADSVTADKIKAGEVTSAKLAADSVTADKIKSGEITSDKIATGAILIGNLASSTVKGITDTVQIGGRNFVLNSDGQISVTVGTSSSVTTKPLSDFGKTELGTIGTKCTISFDAKSDVAGTQVGGRYIRNSSNSPVTDGTDKNHLIDLTTDWVRYSGTCNITATGAAIIGFYVPAGTAGSKVFIKNIKVETGTKATDWTPAPEDVAADITGVQTNLDNLQVGGRNLLLDTDAPSLAKVAAPANRFFANAYDYITPSIVAFDDAPLNIKNGARFVFTATGTGNRNLGFYSGENYIPMVDGETYTISCYARVADGTKLEFRPFYYRTQTTVIGSTELTNTDWQRYSFTFAYNADSCGDTNGKGARIYFGSRATYVGTLELCGFKLEQGNKATDWTPAPEETAFDIQEAKDAAAAARTLAAGKSTVYYSTSNPTTSGTYNAGDVWIKQGTGQQEMWTYTGSAWSKHIAGTTSIMEGAITTDLLASNAVTAEKIKAGSIYANKILISDYTNLATITEKIPDYTISRGSPLGSSKVENGYIVKAGDTNTMIVREWGNNDCRGGDEFYYEFTAHADNAGTAYIGWYGGTSVSSPSSKGYQTTSFVVTTSDQRFTGSIVLPATLSSTAIEEIPAYCFYFSADKTAIGKIYVKDLTIKRKSNGNLIVDGTVTTDLLAANAVTAGKIKAGAVTASSLAIGDFENYATVNEAYADSGVKANYYGATTVSEIDGEQRVCKPGSTTNSMLIRPFGPNNCKAGDVFTYEFTARSEKSYSGSDKMYVRWDGATSATVTSSTAKGTFYSPSMTLTTTDQKFSGTMTLPATLSSTAIEDIPFFAFDIYAKGASFGNVYIKDLVIRKKLQGNLIVDGSITADKISVSDLKALDATIGGFDIGTTSIHNGMTSLSDTTHNGVYVGTDGIALGKGAFKVDNAGALTAKNASLNGSLFTVGDEDTSENPPVRTYVFINNGAAEFGTVEGTDYSDPNKLLTIDGAGTLLTLGRIPQIIAEDIGSGPALVITAGESKYLINDADTSGLFGNHVFVGDVDMINDLLVRGAVTISGTATINGSSPVLAKLLWTNSSPTSEFAAQNVDILTLPDYDMVYIGYGLKTGSANTRHGDWLNFASNVIIKSNLEFNDYDDGARYIRNVTFSKTAKKVLFTATKKFAAGSATFSTDNTFCIPEVIYGIKL